MTQDGEWRRFYVSNHTVRGLTGAPKDVRDYPFDHSHSIWLAIRLGGHRHQSRVPAFISEHHESTSWVQGGLKQGNIGKFEGADVEIWGRSVTCFDVY